MIDFSTDQIKPACGELKTAIGSTIEFESPPGISIFKKEPTIKIETLKDKPCSEGAIFPALFDDENGEKMIRLVSGVCQNSVESEHSSSDSLFL